MYILSTGAGFGIGIVFSLLLKSTQVFASLKIQVCNVLCRACMADICG